MTLSMEMSFVRSPSFHASYLLGYGVAAPEHAVEAEPSEAISIARWATTRTTPRTSSPSRAATTDAEGRDVEGETEWLSPRGCAGSRAGITLYEAATAGLLFTATLRR